MKVQDNEENQTLKRKFEPDPTHRGESTYVAMIHKKSIEKNDSRIKTKRARMSTKSKYMIPRAPSKNQTNLGKKIRTYADSEEKVTITQRMKDPDKPTHIFLIFFGQAKVSLGTDLQRVNAPFLFVLLFCCTKIIINFLLSTVVVQMSVL